jgi:Zn-dependent protease with chaperone function
MTISVYVPLALSLLLAALSRPLARRLSPRTAAPALVLASALAAAATTWGLLLLAATLLQEAPPVTERVSPRALALGEPVPNVVGVAAAAMLAVGLYRLAVTVRSRRSTHRALRQLCDSSAAEELVVVAAREPHAVAVPDRPGRAGRILVTSGMLAALTADERGVLLAHERAHLREGHSWQRAVVDAAAALNPLLRPAREAVAFLLERCADEAAATAVGSRALAARSLARAAFATTAAARAEALAFQQLAVTARVAALQAVPPPSRRLIAAGVVLVGVMTTLAAGDATVAFVALAERLFPGRL